MKLMLPAEPSLIGREQELNQLIELYDSAVEGKGVTVFVSGEAGVGKTRLIKEFLDHAKKKGSKILSGWCLSEVAIPYFPFIEAFNTYMSTERDEIVKSDTTKPL